MDNREDMIMIRPEELKRYQIIGKVFEKSINQQEEAEILTLSDRQIRRIVDGYVKRVSAGSSTGPGEVKDPAALKKPYEKGFWSCTGSVTMDSARFWPAKSSGSLIILRLMMRRCGCGSLPKASGMRISAESSGTQLACP